MHSLVWDLPQCHAIHIHGLDENKNSAAASLVAVSLVEMTAQDLIENPLCSESNICSLVTAFCRMIITPCL